MTHTEVNLDIVLVQGDDFQFRFTLVTDEGVTDITSATVTASLKSEISGLPVLAGKALAITDATAGKATLTITGAESVLFIPEGRFRGDVKVVFSDASVRRFGPYSFQMREAIT